MPLDNADQKPPIDFYAVPYKGKVSVHFFVNGSGLSNEVDLTPTQCAQLADVINEALGKLPRIGTAADLGVEVLP